MLLGFFKLLLLLLQLLLLVCTILLVCRQGSNKAPESRWWVRLPCHNLQNSRDSLKIGGEGCKMIFCDAQLDKVKRYVKPRLGPTAIHVPRKISVELGNIQ